MIPYASAIAQASVARFGAPRLRVATQAGAILGSFLCSYLLYDRIAGVTTLDASTVLGAVTLLVLFLQLRLVDDIDDLEGDLPGDGSEARVARRSRRTAMLLGWAAAAALAGALNAQRPAALASALAAMALMVVTPFGIKRYLTRSPVLLAFPFEATPALIFAYIYFFQSGAATPGATPLQVFVVVGVFWTAYQFWKFSRKVGENAMQPYFLSHQGMQRTLLALLALSSLFQLLLWHVADLSPGFGIYGCALPLAFAVWMLRTWPAEAATDAAPTEAGSARRGWKGLTLIATLSVGLLAELLLQRTAP